MELHDMVHPSRIIHHFKKVVRKFFSFESNQSEVSTRNVKTNKGRSLEEHGGFHVRVVMFSFLF